MQISVSNAQPCEAATLLRTYIYNDKALWLKDEGAGHFNLDLLDDPNALVPVLDGAPSKVLHEAIEQIGQLSGPVMVTVTTSGDDAALKVGVPQGKADDVARGLYRALLRVARPPAQPHLPSYDAMRNVYANALPVAYPVAEVQPKRGFWAWLFGA